jgi:hypothetical protein
MTNQMPSMFDQYGQFIVVDATYKTNEFSRPLLLFTVRYGTGTFFIVGIALIKSESFINLSWAFNQLKHFVGIPAWNRMKVVMTDGDASYPRIISSLVPNAIHQRCWWHQQRNMHSACSRTANPKSCWTLMESAISNYDSIDAENTWKKMMELFVSESGMKQFITPKLLAEAAEKCKDGDEPIWTDALPEPQRNLVKLVTAWYEFDKPTGNRILKVT